MNIKFNKIRLHHFLSFDDSEIILNDRGYCLVSGINKNPKDAAKSNGSGKSTIWNAISYVLTGETTNGLKSNLSNIYFNDGCFVEIEFKVDNDEYKLIRSKDDKKLGTNLKIFINGEDKSGKGIRESQALLDQYLPDLTSELIGSVIILGQGLPQKFTNNTPSGRKEVLEHLSKSDFMIQDIKERISKRNLNLNDEMRKIEDALLVNVSEENLYSQQLISNKKELEKFNIEINFEEKINNEKNKIITLENDINTTNNYYNELNKHKEDINNIILNESELKQNRLNTIRTQHEEITNDFNNIKNDLNNKIYLLKNEIERLKSIKDICPTCGQRIPNVIKQDTSEQENKLNNLLDELKNLNEDIKEDLSNYSNTISKINDEFTSKTKKYQDENSCLISKLGETNSKLLRLMNNKNECEKELIKLENNKNTFESNKNKLLDSISELEILIDSIKNKKLYNNNIKDKLQEHIDVLAKINTLIKRDFRGFLLTNVINYLDFKAKEYANQIFNTNDIQFKLDGNNIDIIFCNKDYENLSGGEKQRVDLIIQFAIRDMLCTYLDFSSNILVLDEITDSLDSISCDKVLNFITKELNYIESVFIISHHSDELEIPYDSEIVIEKNELGVSNLK